MLFPIVWLEIDGSAPGWGFWIVVLALVSVGFVAASAILQWRPFLVSGLLGTADFIVRAFYRLDRDLDASPNMKILAMLGIALVGFVVMFVASYPDRVVRETGAMARSLTVRLGGKG
jgi:hypothetical protein